MSAEARFAAPKPLGKKSYGSIGHLPGSRIGPGDHHIDEGQASKILGALPKGDLLIVQEKLDGSNVGVCLKDGEIIAIGRAGWRADSSPYEQHHAFARWVKTNEERFRRILSEGERVCGEWLALAHGTKYDLTGREPFVAFDSFTADERRLTFADHRAHVALASLAFPHVYHHGNAACPVESIVDAPSFHGAIGGKEGVVYRWERPKENRVLLLAKWVRPDKVDLTPGENETLMHWNWQEAVLHAKFNQWLGDRRRAKFDEVLSHVPRHPRAHRKELCHNGHPLSGDRSNVRVTDKFGTRQRICRTCRNNAQRADRKANSRARDTVLP